MISFDIENKSNLDIMCASNYVDCPFCKMVCKSNILSLKKIKKICLYHSFYSKNKKYYISYQNNDFLKGPFDGKLTIYYNQYISIICVKSYELFATISFDDFVKNENPIEYLKAIAVLS